MSSAVLILDVDWRPLRVTHWTRAIADTLLGKVEVIEYSRDKTIQGVGRAYPMPSVVRVLRRFKHRQHGIKFSRINIYTRDAFTCQYCGQQFVSEELTFDHVVPRCRGGKTTWENIVTACIQCNTRKAHQTPEQAGMALLKKPVKPRWLPTILVRADRATIPTEWQPYWHVSLQS